MEKLTFPAHLVYVAHAGDVGSMMVDGKLKTRGQEKGYVVSSKIS